MTRATDARRDFKALGDKLAGAEGSEAAAVARERRIVSAGLARIDRAAELRADYLLLGRRLKVAEGAGAAAIVRERRLIAEELEHLEPPKDVSLVDQMAEERSRSRTRRPPSRRRKPRGGA